MTTYDDLSDNFAEVKDLSVEEVGEKIGGKVQWNIENGYFKNACAIRMSYAFNYSGIKINQKDGATSSGDDGYWYMYRVKDFINYLEKNYDCDSSKDIDSFEGQQGVIVFNDCGWKDATGHIDLFDGKNVEGSDYSDLAKEIILFYVD